MRNGEKETKRKMDEETKEDNGEEKGRMEGGEKKKYDTERGEGGEGVEKKKTVRV